MISAARDGIGTKIISKQHDRLCTKICTPKKPPLYGSYPVSANLRFEVIIALPPDFHLDNSTSAQKSHSSIHSHHTPAMLLYLQ